MNSIKIDELNKIAAQLRIDVIRMIGVNKGPLRRRIISSGYYGGTVFSQDEVRPQNPQWPERDRFFQIRATLPTQYAALRIWGYSRGGALPR